jgi:hypothetical protein
MSKLIMMVRHGVEDYRKWRPVFDGDMGKQKAAGLTNPSVYRSADDGNAVLILWDAEDKHAGYHIPGSRLVACAEPEAVTAILRLARRVLRA